MGLFLRMILATALGSILGTGVAVMGVKFFKPEAALDGPSDAWVRERVYMLDTEGGACTAVQVLAPSGKTFLLSASHCFDRGHSIAIAYSEDLIPVAVRVLWSDFDKDLVLLTTPNGKQGINVADSVYTHQKVHTLTRGGVLPTHRTDGEVLCEASGYRLCWGPLQRSFKRPLLYTTAAVLHGSSGGPLLDEKNNLAGIVDRVDGFDFSYSVTIADIKAFLKGW